MSFPVCCTEDGKSRDLLNMNSVQVRALEWGQRKRCVALLIEQCCVWRRVLAVAGWSFTFVHGDTCPGC